MQIWSVTVSSIVDFVDSNVRILGTSTIRSKKYVKLCKNNNYWDLPHVLLGIAKFDEPMAGWFLKKEMTTDVGKNEFSLYKFTVVQTLMCLNYKFLNYMSSTFILHQFL